MRETYLDWASSAPVSLSAQKVFERAAKAYGNPSSPHSEGVKARAILEDVRKKLARLVGVKMDGVVFTSGATEANNLAIRGHVKALVTAGRKIENIHLLYLPTCHSSIVETMEALKAEGAEVEKIEILNGAVDLVAFKKQLGPETALVSMDIVCGETGTRYDTRDVRRVLDSYKEVKKIVLHVDASQAPFVESIDANHLGADFLTLDAQKVGGVRGIGALIRTSTLTPLEGIMQGGGQEYGIRPGTENPALAASFATALMEAEKGRDKFKISAREARANLLTTLSTTFTDLSVNVGKDFSPHILNVSFPGRDTDYAVMLLSKAGYAVSTKSACETDSVGSRVVLVMISDEESKEVKETRALSTLRISWGPTTKKRDIQSFAKELVKTIQFLDAHAI